MFRAVLILSLLTVGFFAVLFYFIFKVLARVSPGKKKIQEDIQKMKDEIDVWVKDLVPIGKEELELFSQTQINQVLKKRINISAKGVFTTIYNEPIIAYNYKKYGSGKDALLYARSANHEFAFKIHKDEVKLVIDNELVGTIKSNGVLYAAENNLMIARFNRENAALLPIVIQDRKVGHLSLPANSSSKKEIDQRAFEFLKEDLSGEEKKLFLSLAIYELVTRNL